MNILLIINDALRPDHLGCYGYLKETSPNIDKLAEEGVVFENVFSTSSHTVPCIVSILMGQTPAVHGIKNTKRYEMWIKNDIWKDRITPLKILENEGYLVDGELVLRWKPLGFKRDTKGEKIESYFEQNRNKKWFFLAEPYTTHLPYNPSENYFRMFLDKGYKPDNETLEHLQIIRTKLIVHPPGLVSKLEAGESDPIPDHEADEAHKRTVGIVNLNPCDKPAITALYDGEIRIFDNMIGKWIQKLKKLKILDKTLIIITSDHGEELMERGHVGHSSCNLMGTLYDESIKVPLIIRYPEKLPQGLRIKNLVSQIDIIPTVLELLEIPIPGFVEGNSLLPSIQNRGLKIRKEIFAETIPAGWQARKHDDRIIYCMRTKKWKLIINTDEKVKTKKYELYNLKSDPCEKNNIYSPAHYAVNTLLPKLQSYIKKAKKTALFFNN